MPATVETHVQSIINSNLGVHSAAHMALCLHCIPCESSGASSRLCVMSVHLARIEGRCSPQAMPTAEGLRDDFCKDDDKDCTSCAPSAALLEIAMQVIALKLIHYRLKPYEDKARGSLPVERTRPSTPEVYPAMRMDRKAARYTGNSVAALQPCRRVQCGKLMMLLVSAKKPYEQCPGASVPTLEELSGENIGAHSWQWCCR